MDWTDVAKAVAPLAPTLGGIVGGFIPIPGGALAGQAVGAMIARQFGVPATPDAVHGAITSNPNEVVLAKLNAALEEAKAQYPAIVAIEAAREKTAQVSIENVNETMRAELGHGSFWETGWRSLSGWEFDFFMGAFGLMLLYALGLSAFAGNSTPLKVMTDAWPLILIFAGTFAAMVGVKLFAGQQEKSSSLIGPPQIDVPPPVPNKPAAKR